MFNSQDYQEVRKPNCSCAGCRQKLIPDVAITGEKKGFFQKYGHLIILGGLGLGAFMLNYAINYNHSPVEPSHVHSADITSKLP